MTRVADQKDLSTLPSSPHIARDRPQLPSSSYLGSEQRSIWNSTHLPQRVISDAVAAGGAAALVSPLITMIDRYSSRCFQSLSLALTDVVLLSRAIVLRASHRTPLLPTLRASFHHLLTNPHVFLTSRPCRLISALYFGTYFTANSIDTISSTIQARPSESVTSGSSKFIATTSVNISLCLYKDSQFAKMFGAPIPCLGAASKIPRASYALFAARDSLTVFASFNLPPLISPLLPWGVSAERYVSRASAAQYLGPAAIQLLSTPLHLLGLDLYNRPRVRLSDRFGRIVRDWGGASLARMGRVVPAFGIGGVINGKIRRRMMGMQGACG